MYQLTNTTAIIRTRDGAYIPADEANTDYSEYLEWLKAGNTPEAAKPAPGPDIEALRRAAYQLEADPLFFKAQRGESTEQVWLDKIEAIRQRYPDADQ